MLVYVYTHTEKDHGFNLGGFHWGGWTKESDGRSWMLHDRPTDAGGAVRTFRKSRLSPHISPPQLHYLEGSSQPKGTKYPHVPDKSAKDSGIAASAGGIRAHASDFFTTSVGSLIERSLGSKGLTAATRYNVVSRHRSSRGGSSKRRGTSTTFQPSDFDVVSVVAARK